MQSIVWKDESIISGETIVKGVKQLNITENYTECLINLDDKTNIQQI